MPHLTEEACNCLSNTTEGRLALKVIVALEERAAFAEEAKARAEEKLETDTAAIREKNKRMGAFLGKITRAARSFYSQKGTLKALMMEISTLLKSMDPKDGPFPQTMIPPSSPPGASLLEMMEELPPLDKREPRDFAMQLSLCLNIDKTHAQAIFDGTADLTPELISKIVMIWERPSAAFWANRQRHYNEAKAVHGYRE